MRSNNNFQGDSTEGKQGVKKHLHNRRFLAIFTVIGSLSLIVCCVFMSINLRRAYAVSNDEAYKPLAEKFEKKAAGSIDDFASVVCDMATNNPRYHSLNDISFEFIARAITPGTGSRRESNVEERMMQMKQEVDWYFQDQIYYEYSSASPVEKCEIIKVEKTDCEAGFMRLAERETEPLTYEVWFPAQLLEVAKEMNIKQCGTVYARLVLDSQNDYQRDFMVRALAARINNRWQFLNLLSLYMEILYVPDYYGYSSYTDEEAVDVDEDETGFWEEDEDDYYDDDEEEAAEEYYYYGDEDEEEEVEEE